MTRIDTNVHAEGTTPSPVRRRRWPWIVAAAVLFLAGVIAGSGVTVAVAVHRLRYAVSHPQEMPHRLATRLAHRLDLTAEQTQRVEEALARRQAKLMAIRRDAQPRVEREIKGAVEDVAATLSPEQAERWRRMVSDFRAAWLPPPAPATQEAE